MRAYVFVCLWVGILCMNDCVSVCVFKCVCMYAHACACACVYVYACICVCVCRNIPERSVSTEARRRDVLR
jgi:hypothetical protein